MAENIVFLSLTHDELNTLIIDCMSAVLRHVKLPDGGSLIEGPIGIEEAGKYLDLAKPTLYALCQAGKIPSYKQGKKWFFFASELNDWIRKGSDNSIEQRAEESFLAANKKRL